MTRPHRNTRRMMILYVHTLWVMMFVIPPSASPSDNWLRKENLLTKIEIFQSLLSKTQPSRTRWPNQQAFKSKCTHAIGATSPTDCNCVYENEKSEISVSFGRKMASFEHHYFQEDRDRPLHYHFFNGGESSILYSCYWLVHRCAFLCIGSSKVKIWPKIHTCAPLAYAHQRLRPSLPNMLMLLSPHYGMITAIVIDLYSCMS